MTGHFSEAYTNDWMMNDQIWKIKIFLRSNKWSKLSVTNDQNWWASWPGCAWCSFWSHTFAGQFSFLFLVIAPSRGIFDHFLFCVANDWAFLIICELIFDCFFNHSSFDHLQPPDFSEKVHGYRKLWFHSSRRFVLKLRPEALKD